LHDSDCAIHSPVGPCNCSMNEYEGQRTALIEYLKVKLDQSDWHGVSDAANDLRVLEAEHSAESQRTLGKYAPIIEAVNAKVTE